MVSGILQNEIKNTCFSTPGQAREIELCGTQIKMLKWVKSTHQHLSQTAPLPLFLNQIPCQLSVQFYLLSISVSKFLSWSFFFFLFFFSPDQVRLIIEELCMYLLTCFPQSLHVWNNKKIMQPYG